MQGAWGRMGATCQPTQTDLPEIAGIIRVSTKGQAGSSPENQRQVLAAAGATRFFEAVESGYKAKRRESLQPLFDAIANGEISKLLATDLSRAARSQELLNELIALTDQHGVEFLAGGMAITHGDAYQWFSAQQLQLQAELYSRDLSGRIRRGQAAAISRGQFGFTSNHLAWHLAKDPYDPRKVIKHPERWDTARELVVGYIEGKLKSGDISRIAYERHQVMRLPGAVTKWLRSHWLRGHYGKRDGEVLIANCAPALITEGEAELLQQRIDANRKTKGTRAPYQVHALTGLCRCLSCGNTMTTNRPKGRDGRQYSYVRCIQPGCPAKGLNIAADKLEREIQELLDQVDLETMERGRLQRQLVTKPSKELVNLKAAAKKLREALELLDSQGLRAELQQTEQRIRELEGAHKSEPPRLSLRQVREMGSEQWWNQRDEQQRNTDYLSVLDYVGVGVSEQWRGVQYLKFKGWRWTDDGELVPEQGILASLG
jgi:DNA invertase Pin-like site-specific DNA recombinase